MKHGNGYPISRREAVLLIGVLTGVAHAQKSLAIEKIDLFPAFLRCLNEATAESSQVRARRFVDQVVTPHMELFNGFTGEVSVERAEQYLEKIQPFVGDIQTLHKWIAASFDDKLDAFKKHLPEFEWAGSVVFMPTLFGFDAGGGQMDGRSCLVFGLDMIAKKRTARKRTCRFSSRMSSSISTTEAFTKRRKPKSEERAFRYFDLFGRRDWPPTRVSN